MNTDTFRVYSRKPYNNRDYHNHAYLKQTPRYSQGVADRHCLFHIGDLSRSIYLPVAITRFREAYLWWLYTGSSYSHTSMGITCIIQVHWCACKQRRWEVLLIISLNATCPHFAGGMCRCYSLSVRQVATLDRHFRYLVAITYYITLYRAVDYIQ